MDLTINWKGDMTFEGAGNSGYLLQMDTDRAVGGNDSAVRPMELIALGLAGCTAMDVISILKKKQQKTVHFLVKLHADRSKEHPKVFTKAVIEYHVTGVDILEEAVKRAIELSVTKYCPGYAMLSKSFPMELRYSIYDENGYTRINDKLWTPAT